MNDATKSPTPLISRKKSSLRRLSSSKQEKKGYSVKERETTTFCSDRVNGTKRSMCVYRNGEREKNFEFKFSLGTNTLLKNVGCSD